MKIALDAMGGDTAPQTTVAGAVRAARELPADAEIVLVGKEQNVRSQLQNYNNLPPRISVVHAEEVVGMDAPAAASIRKRNSSISVAVQLLKERKVDAFVSAGNTGAVVSAATLSLGMLEGIERPGIAVVLPGLQGDTLLIDVGANIQPKPMHMLQYALMGEAYARCVLGRERPTIGLLNVGEEAGKGTGFTKETYSLLESSGINFVGNAEGHDIFAGEIDVIVCDGFAGNVALKTAESLARAINKIMKRAFTQSWLTRFGAFLARDAFRQLRAETDYAEKGGAPLLGVDGIAIIAHGGSGAKAIKNALHVAYQSVSSNLNGVMVDSVDVVNKHVSHERSLQQ